MLTPYPWCLVNAPLKTKRCWINLNTLHLSYIYILIFNKCHIVKISVKEPRSSGHQERGHHDQDHDDHSGPGGKAHRAVTVVTVTVAEIPNGLSLLINHQAFKLRSRSKTISFRMKSRMTYTCIIHDPNLFVAFNINTAVQFTPKKH